MRKSELTKLKRRLDEVEQKNVSLIAERGKLMMERVEMMRDHREELNAWLHAGLLLMREVMKAKIRKYGPDLTNAGMPRVGVKALARHVDPGLLGLNPESLEIFADRVVELLEAEALRDGYEGKNDELKTPRKITLVLTGHDQWGEPVTEQVVVDKKMPFGITEASVDQLVKSGRGRLRALDKAKRKPSPRRVSKRR